MNTRWTVSVLAALTVTLAAPATVAGTSYSDVQKFEDESVVDGTSILTRTKKGVAYTLNTRMLRKNRTYTNWFVTFNNPRKCNTPCACDESDFENSKVRIGVFWATGRISDRHGQAVFSGHTDYGKLPTGFDQIVEGLERPLRRRSEIHIVVRDHGKPLRLRRKVEEQLNSFNGGCGRRDCKDVLFAIHRSPFCKAH